MNRHALFVVAAAVLAAAPLEAQSTRLLREPTVSARHIAFSYANDIWIVEREGGEARRLTSFPGQETNPQLSPDGRWVAFSGQYGGNTDVYVVPVEGGEPRRLTWHPGPDIVQGWTPDGQRVVFSSSRENAPRGAKFFTVGLDADFPQALPMPRAHRGEHSPDGTRFAYQMVSPWEDEFRNYRGGQNRPVWILDLDDYTLETPPWEGSNDIDPVWLGDEVYFLSDRDWAMNVWAYDTRTKRLRQVTTFRDYDVKNLDAGGGVLVFEQAGMIHLYDPAEGRSRPVDIRVAGDFPWAMPRWESVGDRLTNAKLSPTGKRAVFEARGEIFTVPAEEGDWRNLTNSPGVADRQPTWSPDGRKIAWFSDEGGEYRLVIADQAGIGERRVIELESKTFYFTPAWSPDSKKIVFTDTHLNLWYVDVETGRNVKVDTDNWLFPQRTIDPVWSPDSRYIAYAKRLANKLHAVFVYSLEEGKSYQVTDGMVDALSPAWDASGKYLYFLASTDVGLNTGWLDMSSYDRPTTRGVYLAVLSASEPSPLLPKTGDEAVAAARGSTAGQGQGGGEGRGGATAGAGRGGATPSPSPSPRPIQIDFAGIANRIVALNVPRRNYTSLVAGVEGTVFFGEVVPNQQGVTVHRYTLEERRAQPFLVGVQFYTLSADGKKLLYRAGGGGPGGSGGQGGATWGIVDATARTAPKVGDGRLNTAALRMRVDPRAEWRQMFVEGWRFQRDFLYVPNTHGADWQQVRAMYEPWVEHVRHRSDLTYLLDVMGAELSVGHSFVRGGDLPDIDEVSVGLLGADLEIHEGRYRIKRIYRGDPWTPEMRAPLAAPGLRVAEGDYILEVNGVELRAPENPYRLFENTANRQTFLRVNRRPTHEGSWVITVVPVASESALRTHAWVEENRRKVDELSGGRLAYVWLPNTGQGGYTAFNREYFAQQDKQGAIIDERFNGGGSAADYIVDIMARRLHGYFNNAVADRRPFTSPGAGIWGPKVMIVNEMAGSGGDLLPYMFRFLGIGPLVGTRTWGGLVGTWDTPPLIDGGVMIAPRGGFFNLDAEWDVENEGVAPDIEVEMTPAEVIAGRDPQLEAAVKEALRLLEANPVRLREEPPPPNKWRRPGMASSGQ